jgi:thioredoxin reductase
MSAHSVLVIGGGIAGCSAALEAQRLGLAVTLVDEHPQSVATMSLDTPYFYGSRLAPVLSDTSAIAERVLGSSTLLMDCLEAGVEVLTQTCAWGSYRPGPNSRSVELPRVGLADAERSWIATYDSLILATGARDLVLSFPGWQLPGVMGAAGVLALATRYQALAATRCVVLGSGALGLEVAQRLLDAGVEVPAVVDVSATPRGDAQRHAALRAAGVQFHLSRVITAAIGARGVEGVRLQSVEEAGSADESIACDTVCIAIGLVPNIELAALTGCTLEFRADLGGWVPLLDQNQCSSVQRVYVVGDAAGTADAMLRDGSVAQQQGQRAARAIAACEGLADAAAAVLPAGADRSGSLAQPNAIECACEWLRALVSAGGLDVVVCQCEEVTRRDLLELRPPGYVRKTTAAPRGQRADSGSLKPDLVKRLTRAGMGHCQGKRCREHTALLLAQMHGLDPASISCGSYRAPVRPLPLQLLASGSDEDNESWPTWFHPLSEGEIG